MRWTRVVAGSSLVLVSTVAVFVASCGNQTTGGNNSASSASTALTPEQKLALGKRLTWASGCNDCHTPGAMYGAPDTTRLLSGSELGWSGPWGVSYPRNLTPDPETGIGSWTEDQIAAAIKTGVRPNGSPILPPMPWPSFALGFTDEDAHAIAAYLKTLPPVRHALPAVVPPGGKVTGAVLTMPPPPAWDAQNLPPPPGAPAATGDGSAKH